MKKLIYFAMILALAFVSSCKKDKIETLVVPHWETELGLASFATNQIWTITGRDIIKGTDREIKQVWSDAVQTTICSNKTSYDGYNETGHNVDCRSNPGQKGDFFSWRAVAEVENLCPEGWRVPTSQDFFDLHSAVTVKNDGYDNYRQLLIDRWGATLNGYCSGSGGIYPNPDKGFYWMELGSMVLGDFFYHGESNPYFPDFSVGHALRCIRE